MKLALGIICAAMCLCFLWVGSYLVHLWPASDWRQFPAMMTTLLAACGSLYGSICCLGAAII